MAEQEITDIALDILLRVIPMKPDSGVVELAKESLKAAKIISEKP